MAKLVDLIPTPLGRTATAQEIANIIVYMLSDAASYIHGSIVWADGGTDAAIRPDAF
jgi:enoyl-[acyl-carrier-protein] reductase (NADH)